MSDKLWRGGLILSAAPGKPAMKFVFGPVPSRRLGQSLGIDTIPLKTCNWNCVYCQLGRSVPLVTHRAEYIPRQAILADVAQTLETFAPGEIDWVTFVGSGEPTLHSGLGWLIREVRKLTDLPLAVITNGSLLYQPEVRQELSAADAVLPSLDAGNPCLYRKINRPAGEFTFERLVDGLISFRQTYRGLIWLEVMLIAGVNDSPEALEELARVLERIHPDRVDITQPTRPPAENWVEAPSPQQILLAEQILGKVARAAHEGFTPLTIKTGVSLPETILDLITRHPVAQDDLENALGGWQPAEVRSVLVKLQTSGVAKIVCRFGRRYWSSAGARFSGQ
jgi:wyosine [tRNA(Phe)-imidazoG37] synthetase (radical SAM superfamily)